MGNLIAKTRAMLTRLDTDEVVDPVLLLSPIELTTVLQTDRLDKREVCVGIGAQNGHGVDYTRDATGHIELRGAAKHVVSLLTELSFERLVLRWVNLVLREGRKHAVAAATRSGSRDAHQPRRVVNWGTDFRDSSTFGLLTHYLSVFRNQEAARRALDTMRSAQADQAQHVFLRASDRRAAVSKDPSTVDMYARMQVPPISLPKFGPQLPHGDMDEAAEHLIKRFKRMGCPVMLSPHLVSMGVRGGDFYPALWVCWLGSCVCLIDSLPVQKAPDMNLCSAAWLMVHHPCLRFPLAHSSRLILPDAHFQARQPQAGPRHHSHRRMPSHHRSSRNVIKGSAFTLGSGASRRSVNSSRSSGTSRGGQGSTRRRPRALVKSRSFGSGVNLKKGDEGGASEGKFAPALPRVLSGHAADASDASDANMSPTEPRPPLSTRSAGTPQSRRIARFDSVLGVPEPSTTGVAVDHALDAYESDSSCESVGSYSTVSSYSSDDDDERFTLRRRPGSALDDAVTSPRGTASTTAAPFRPSSPSNKPDREFHRHKFLHVRKVLAKLKDPMLLKPSSIDKVRAVLSDVRTEQYHRFARSY